MTRERYHRIMHDVEQELLQMGEMVVTATVTGEIVGE
jgi:hypothetical protein